MRPDVRLVADGDRTRRGGKLHVALGNELRAIARHGDADLVRVVVDAVRGHRRGPGSAHLRAVLHRHALPGRHREVRGIAVGYHRRASVRRNLEGPRLHDSAGCCIRANGDIAFRSRERHASFADDSAIDFNIRLGLEFCRRAGSNSSIDLDTRLRRF